MTVRSGRCFPTTILGNFLSPRCANQMVSGYDWSLVCLAIGSGYGLGR